MFDNLLVKKQTNKLNISTHMSVPLLSFSPQLAPVWLPYYLLSLEFLRAPTVTSGKLLPPSCVSPLHYLATVNTVNNSLLSWKSLSNPLSFQIPTSQFLLVSYPGWSSSTRLLISTCYSDSISGFALHCYLPPHCNEISK